MYCHYNVSVEYLITPHEGAHFAYREDVIVTLPLFPYLAPRSIGRRPAWLMAAGINVVVAWQHGSRRYGRRKEGWALLAGWRLAARRMIDLAY